MTGRRLRLRVGLLALAALACAPAAHGGTRIAFCSGRQLGGSFALVRGSAGAGSVSYALRLRNRSSRPCSLTGLPVVRLLGRTGKPLPTKVRAVFPGALTAILVTLAPGQTATATARFSPDVTGPREQHPGACEPTAHRLRVTAPGGGTATVPVRPATPVCEYGRLLFSAYGRG